MSGIPLILTVPPLIPNDANLQTAQINSLSLSGSTDGTVLINPATTTLSYTITLPNTQGTTNSYLKNDGSGTLTWDSTIVVNPSTSTDKALVRFNGTNGKIIQNSTVTLSNTGEINGITNISLKASNSNILAISPSPTTTPYSLILPPSQGVANSYLRNDGNGILSWVVLPYVAGSFYFGDIGGGSSGPLTVNGDFTGCSKSNGTFGINPSSTFVVTWTPRGTSPKSFAANYYAYGSTDSSDNDIVMPLMTSFSDGSITLVCEESNVLNVQHTGIMLTIFY